MSNFIAISKRQLDNVTGGGSRGRAISKGIRRAYQVARPIIREVAAVAQDLGVIGGVAYGAKKTWDWMRGNPQPQPQQPQE